MELWIGLNIFGLEVFRFVEGNILIFFVNIVAVLDRIFLNKFFVIIVLNCFG